MLNCAINNNNYQEPLSPKAGAEVNLHSHPDLIDAQTATECASLSLGPKNLSLNIGNSNKIDKMAKSVAVKHSSTVLTTLSGKSSSQICISAQLYHDEDTTNANDLVDIGVCTEMSEESEISVIPEPFSVLPTSNSVWVVPEPNIAATKASKIDLLKIQSTDNEVKNSNKNNENYQDKPMVKLDTTVNENSARPGLLSTLIIDAADGVVAPETIKNIWGVIDHIVNETQQVPSADQQKECCRRMFSKPILPSVFHDLEDSQLAKILKYVPLQEKRRIRLVCSRWKSVLDSCFLKFQRLLTRNSIQFLRNWSGTPMHKLIVCDLLDVSPDVLHKLAIFSTVKELQIESPRPEDYDTRQKYNNPTIGEINLVKILQCCHNIESLILNETALGNFGLEVLSKATVECETDTVQSDCVTVTVDKNGNEIIKGEKNSEFLVGWKWADTHNVTKGVSAVSAYFQKIMNDLDDSMYTCDGKIGMEPHSDVIPPDPPVLEISYQQEIQPSFSAFATLNTVDLHRLRKLTIKVQPTQTTEKLSLIAFLHVLTFPQLRSFSLFVHEYFPDEALYQTIVKFIAKHHATLRHLTFINPVLSSRINAKPTLCHLLGLEKVKLKSFTVSWEKLIGLEQFWADGLYLLGLQKRLHTLNVHTSKVLKVEAAIWNNFRFLTQAYIHISDTAGYSNKIAKFDCNCFTHCSKLKILSLRVGLAVEIKNVCQIPDTIERLHWYARYSQNDIRWFSRFLVLAKSIYFYHEKDVPIEVLTPLNLNDFINFIQLPSLEQLKLPKITQQDPRVTRFCERCSQGLVQHKDLFFIDRNLFFSVQEECLKIADLSCW